MIHLVHGSYRYSEAFVKIALTNDSTPYTTQILKFQKFEKKKILLCVKVYEELLMKASGFIKVVLHM
jgi:hypothetical protein